MCVGACVFACVCVSPCVLACMSMHASVCVCVFIGVTFFSKYKVSLLCEHIHEGIYLQLVAKNTLTRNIYSRHT